MRVWIVLVLATLSQTATADDAMRCGARLVTTGALAAEVLGVCGEPDYRDAWLLPRPAGYVADTEEWTYNFGANQLLRVLRFQQGRLADIATDGYGFDAPPRAACGPADLTTGISKYRLLARCGDPATREAMGVVEPVYRHGRYSTTQFEDIYRERWVYDFGSNYLLHIVTLKNGRVTDIDTGARGSDRR
jgi:hypothetical protein